MKASGSGVKLDKVKVSGPVFIETSITDVTDTEIKKEETPEEDPLSDTNKTANITLSVNHSETVTENIMLDTEQRTQSWQPEEDDDLEMKIEIADEALIKTEST